MGEGIEKPTKRREVWATEESRRRQAAARVRDREIGQTLRQVRLQMGRSVAECARYAGLSRGHYQDIESGDASLAVHELEALMTLLDLPLAELLRPLAALSARSTVQMPTLDTSGQPVEVVLDVYARANVRPLPTQEAEPPEEG